MRVHACIVRIHFFFPVAIVPAFCSTAFVFIFSKFIIHRETVHRTHIERGVCAMALCAQIDINNGSHYSEQVSIWAECIRRKL